MICRCIPTRAASSVAITSPSLRTALTFPVSTCSAAAMARSATSGAVRWDSNRPIPDRIRAAPGPHADLDDSRFRAGGTRHRLVSEARLRQVIGSEARARPSAPAISPVGFSARWVSDHRDGLGLLTAHPAIDDAGDHRTQQRRDPEQPQLRQRPAADKHRGPCAARGIHGRVGDGDADQVDQRQAQANASGAKPFGALPWVEPRMTNKIRMS